MALEEHSFRHLLPDFRSGFAAQARTPVPMTWTRMPTSFPASRR
jgi:hypothetical protein